MNRQKKYPIVMETDKYLYTLFFLEPFNHIQWEKKETPIGFEFFSVSHSEQFPMMMIE